MTNPTVPASMRAAVLRGPGALALERVDVPRRARARCWSASGRAAFAAAT